ncbi:VOC family protein [Roseateles terrae]|uniref:PhnB protein n=1 Tax=Roseateles terrae TaxID=431060 RepID=A0ABR6GNM5_9BURK|nr:VOC family protein [Roseateles terrae]MBB3192839.1 PhnB protein [Roseateles terrae]OWQ89893.1 hypothetical protein CDN98_05205 [Roseateles terrae]
MTPISYLQFDGRCAEALTFYAQALGGKVLMMALYSDAPSTVGVPTVPPHWVMHGRVGFPDGGMLMGSDGGPEPFQGYKGVSLSLSPKDLASGEAVFKALSEGGEVRMPFQSTFWSPGFGTLVDKFGVPWMVNVDAPQ